MAHAAGLDLDHHIMRAWFRNADGGGGGWGVGLGGDDGLDFVVVRHVPSFFGGGLLFTIMPLDLLQGGALKRC